MRAWLHAHREAIAQAALQFLRRPVTALLSVAVIGVGLLFPLGGHIVVANLKALAAGAGADPQINVFMAPEASGTDRTEIERRLRLEPKIGTFRFVGKEAAFRELQSRTGAGDLMAGLASNPLPDTYLVTPRETSSAMQSKLADTIRSWPGVGEVDVDTVWADRLRALASTGDLVVLAVGVLLGLAMLAISFNTVRLQVLTSAEEMTVLRLFGATPSYIRRPFLYFGALQGVVAALFAWVVADGSVLWIESRLAAFFVAYGLSGRLEGLSTVDGLALVGFSALVGVLGAWSASGEY